MTFLNGLFLMALPLVAVPILLHFLRRRQKKVIKWGAMKFLEEAVAESQRMQRPESLLLLLLRCAMVIGLILALARPLMNWGTSRNKDQQLIVIVDDSLSTARRVGDGTQYDQIREMAHSVLSDAKQDSQFRILLASGGGRWLNEHAVSWNSAEGDASLDALANSQPTRGTTDLLACVHRAIGTVSDRQTSGTPHPAQRIVVVTDGTLPSWHATNENTLERFRASLEQAGSPVQIQVLEVTAGDEPFRNLAIVALESDQGQVGLDKTVRLRGEVKNVGTQSMDECLLEWKVDGKSRGHSSVPELQVGQSAEVSWSFNLKAAKWKEPGPLAISGLINPSKPDDLKEDSIAMTVVEVVKEIPVLLIDNAYTESSSDSLPQELVFLTSALGYAGEEANENYHSVFAPQIVSAADALTEDLSLYHAIFVRGADNDSPELPELLATEIRRGCGVWISLGPDTDVDRFNQYWYRDGAGLSPLALVEPPEEVSDDQESSETAKQTNLHPPSDRHPATRVLSDQQRIDLDEVTIERHAWFEPLVLGDEVSVPLKSDRGQPLVIENMIGKGRVMIQAFPFSLEATTWPVTNSFVVMVHDWFEYLALPSATAFNLTSGSPIVWHFDDVSNRPAWLTLPDGTKIDLAEHKNRYDLERDSGSFRYFATGLPGTYQIRTSAIAGNPREIPFNVLTASEELVAEQMPAEKRSELIDIGGMELSESVEPLSRSAAAFWSEQRSRPSVSQGRPIWHWIIAALTGMLLIELLLAGRIGARRGGLVTSATNTLANMGGGQQSTTRKRTPVTVE